MRWLPQRCLPNCDLSSCELELCWLNIVRIIEICFGLVSRRESAKFGRSCD